MIPLLAAIEGNLVFLIVVAVIGVINWLVEKVKKKAGDEPARPNAAPRQSQPGGSSDSEQERLRRFMEALGIPQQQQPQPRPQPQRQAPAPAQQQRQVVRPPERVRPAQNTARTSQKPPPKKKPKPPVLEPEEFQRAGRIEEAATAIEQISSEFEAMNVRVSMPASPPFERPDRLATAKSVSTSVAGHDSNPLVKLLRRTLTNPADARSALLVAELLAPPKALRD